MATFILRSETPPQVYKPIIIGEKAFGVLRHKSLSVPHLKDLRAEDYLHLELAYQYRHYIPEHNYYKFQYMEWLASIWNILVGQKSKDFTEEKICARVKLIVNKKKLNEIALPQFINIFKKLKYIKKGRSHT